ncbi:MAG TPA: hypothetical protein VNU20_10645 [Candidatus Sulfotelmatobacter sp.]|jgi:hypothetical protein|nr:hypothetical protein [Candidatus Sulfotelmatobacter sp.]
MKNSDYLLDLPQEMARESGRGAGSAQGARQIDALNRAIAARIQRQGFAPVLTTELRAQTALHPCTINLRTTEMDIAKTVEAPDGQARNESGYRLVSG